MSDHHAPTDEHAQDHAAVGHDPGHDSGHDAGHGGDSHGHDAGHGIVALGPIDWRMWGIGVLGVVVALIIVGGFVVATGFSFSA